MVGPGGASISGDLIAYHYYDGDNNGAITLGIRHIHWGPGGWPVLTYLH
jgi:arabinan endo-1,5-alpha-L-arabinosidase